MVQPERAKQLLDQSTAVTSGPEPLDTPVNGRAWALTIEVEGTTRFGLTRHSAGQAAALPPGCPRPKPATAQAGRVELAGPGQHEWLACHDGVLPSLMAGLTHSQSTQATQYRSGASSGSQVSSAILVPLTSDRAISR